MAEGFDIQNSDEGTMRLVDKRGTIIGLLALHVDDALGGGTDAVTKVMTKVGEKLQIGSHETAATKKRFFYRGLRVYIVNHTLGHLKSKFEIVLDGNDLDSVLLMQEPLGDDTRVLTLSEAKDFRSVAGCVGYMDFAFRCDLSVETSMLGGSFFRTNSFECQESECSGKISERESVCFTFSAWCGETNGIC